MSFRRSIIVILTLIAAAAIGAAALLLRSGPADLAGGGAPALGGNVSASAVEHVGRATCARCHAEAAAAWHGSHHDLAMQEIGETTVLADFDDATFTKDGVTSSFSRAADSFRVTTDGPEGALRAYEISYVFGVDPLQQYLVAFPGGRYQVLSLSWDARPESEGGQRWFHLYPDETIPAGDELHWTQRSQNWNYMCAECHSTNLRRNYDAASNRYETTWSEIDVSCEACHGPGARHVAWAEAEATGVSAYEDPDMGMLVRFEPPDATMWGFDGEAPTAVRREPVASRLEIEMCGRCHARRAQIHDAYEHGRPLLDTHRVAFLDEGLYHADGQILEEVYVYGSFLQSKMYAAGVTCSDCHDAHTLELLAPGNQVCYRCHVATVFDTPSHHFHEPDSAGATCVGCHMPERRYMVVDPRSDHGVRVPRPDLSVALGTPNACNDCHDDQPPAWAAAKVAEWYGPGRRQEKHFGEALHAGRRGAAGSAAALVELIRDVEQPAIARATAIALLRLDTAPEALPAVTRALEDDDALVRLAAVEALAQAAPAERGRLAAPRLTDPLRTVRIAAARLLAPLRGRLADSTRLALDEAVAELVHAERVNADQPWAHVNLGNHYVQTGRIDEALRSYRDAVRLEPTFDPGWVNLADVLRAQGRDDESERVLREALGHRADSAAVNHALGLTLVRRGQLEDAIERLTRAAELAPEMPRFAYVYGVALADTGQLGSALRVLERAHERHPNDCELLWVLATMHAQAGDPVAALDYARRLVLIAPGRPDFRALRDQLEQSVQPP